MKKKENQSSKTFFEYRRMINYFMTVFFIFLLMVSILLFINLSRTVLSDSNIERHLTDTKSLLEELEEVEKSGTNRFANVSTNFNDYPQKNILNRLEIEDLSITGNIENTKSPTFLTFKTSKYTFEKIESSTIVTNIEPQLYDIVIFEDNSENYQRGLIIELNRKDDESESMLKDDSLNTVVDYVVLRDSNFNAYELESIEEIDNSSQILENEIIVLSMNSIRGIELKSNS